MYNGGELYLRSVHREWKRKKKRKGKWYKREHRITKAQRDRIETTVPVNFAGPIGFPVESREIRDESGSDPGGRCAADRRENFITKARGINFSTGVSFPSRVRRYYRLSASAIINSEVSESYHSLRHKVQSEKLTPSRISASRII